MQVALPAALSGPGRWFLLAGLLKVLLLSLHSPVSFAVMGASPTPLICAQIRFFSSCVTVTQLRRCCTAWRPGNGARRPAVCSG